MIICAHDPGPTQSALCFWDTELDRPASVRLPLMQEENALYLREFALVLDELVNMSAQFIPVFIEQVINYGHVMDLNARNTLRYSGRIEQIALDTGCPVFYVPYSDVGVHLAGSRHAKQSAINASLAARHGYGDVVEAKRKGNVFNGVKEHIWSAAALATFATDQIRSPGGFSSLDKYKVTTG